ncbi:MAG: OmpA family protein [Cyclobacteriaceae bacterium]|nr:OmpA family protein [Cyclobacteriaceae bacterium]UYN86748.1 MAG: OmpA family protein [Cyclobacteriaceae bacterium]
MRALFILGFCIFSIAGYAQADSLVVAQGRIINADTREPIVARITYQNLPFGNRMGVINNSSFSFPLFDGERYSITVDAVGYASVKYMLDPAEADGNKKLVRDIELHHTTGNPNKKHVVGHVMRLDNLIFEVAKARIDPDSYAELDLLVGMMNEHKTMVIQLEGHTDYLGDPAKNMKLSQQRVDAVRDYLISKGINKNRIKLKAFGGTMPLSRDSTPEGHRLNRRVEVRILQD